jgi:hypothetical protein
MTPAENAKYLLTRVGARLGAGGIRLVHAATNYLDVGWWFQERPYGQPRRLASREHVWAEIARDVGDQKVLYLEFGVFQGASLRAWSRLLRHPEARLEGFDSFEGLPEDWNPLAPKGHFSQGGALPQLPDDARIRLHRGWFEDTVPAFEPPPHDVLVLNIDADLYSSTKTVLDRLGHLVKPGSWLYFDEFSDRNHERRAFDEWVASSGRRFEAKFADKPLIHVAFRCVG